jgi:hypothetical protein
MGFCIRVSPHIFANKYSVLFYSGRRLIDEKGQTRTIVDGVLTFIPMRKDTSAMTCIVSHRRKNSRQRRSIFSPDCISNNIIPQPT